MVENDLSLFIEIGNLSLGSGASALSMLLEGKNVSLAAKEAKTVVWEQVPSLFAGGYLTVETDITGDLSGKSVFIMPKKDMIKIASSMVGGEAPEETTEIGDIELSIITEAMNQLISNSMSSLGNFLGKKFDSSPVIVKVVNGTAAVPEGFAGKQLVLIKYSLTVEEIVESEFVQLMTLDFSQKLLEIFSQPVSEPEEISQPIVADADTKEIKSPAKESKIKAKVNDISAQEDITKLLESAVAASEKEELDFIKQEEKPKAKSRAKETIFEKPKKQPVFAEEEEEEEEKPKEVIKRAKFDSFEETESLRGLPANIDLIMDVPLQITVELGRAKKSIREILELSSGSIVELDKLDGEPVDILANGRLFAKGEVVVIGETFGVRVVEIISPQDRIKGLRE